MNTIEISIVKYYNNYSKDLILVLNFYYELLMYSYMIFQCYSLFWKFKALARVCVRHDFWLKLAYFL